MSNILMESPQDGFRPPEIEPDQFAGIRKRIGVAAIAAIAFVGGFTISNAQNEQKIVDLNSQTKTLGLDISELAGQLEEVRNENHEAGFRIIELNGVLHSLGERAVVRDGDLSAAFGGSYGSHLECDDNKVIGWITAEELLLMTTRDLSYAAMEGLNDVYVNGIKREMSLASSSEAFYFHESNFRDFKVWQDGWTVAGTEIADRLPEDSLYPYGIPTELDIERAENNDTTGPHGIYRPYLNEGEAIPIRECDLHVSYDVPTTPFDSPQLAETLCEIGFFENERYWYRFDDDELNVCDMTEAQRSEISR